MPNWCDCEMRVYGPKSDRDEFAKFVAIANRYNDKPSILSFESILPYPKHFTEMDIAREAMPPGPEKWAAKDGYNSGGYQWCISNWGTKWDASDVTREESKERILYRFLTAWSPPRPFILALSKKFPSLKLCLKYFERGMGYQGKYYIKGDVIIMDEEYDYRGSRGG